METRDKVLERQRGLRLRYVFTRVEKQDALHPGLRAYIDSLSAHGATGEEIQEAVQQKYQVFFSLSTLGSYQDRRWLPSERRIERTKETARGIIRVFRAEGVKDPRFEQVFHRCLIDCPPRRKPKGRPPNAKNERNGYRPGISPAPLAASVGAAKERRPMNIREAMLIGYLDRAVKALKDLTRAAAGGSLMSEQILRSTADDLWRVAIEARRFHEAAARSRKK